MPESKRQKIVSAIAERMQTILTADGFETDLGQNVHDWRINFQEDELSDTGALSVCDQVATVPEYRDGRSDPKESIWMLPIEIRIFFKKADGAANVRKGLKDVNQAIRGNGGQSDRFPVANVGTVMISRPLKEGVFVPDDNYEVIGGLVEFEVQFITAKFNSEG